MGISGYFQSGGEAYARNRPSYPPALGEALAAACSGHRLALDIGCGTGQLSILLADHFEQVVATDLSQDQIANATSHPAVDYRLEGAELLSVRDQSADLIVAAQAAHWFDIERFYDECRRVGQAGAIVALVSYGVPYLEDPLNAIFQRFYWQQIHRFWPVERHHVETAYTELSFPFENVALPLLAIRHQWGLEALLGYIATWSASRRAVESGEGQLLDQFAAQLAGLWGAQDQTRTVVWPLTVRAGYLN